MLTINAIQVSGRFFFKASVVKQKDAFVFFAISLYFFEWKKVISFSVEEDRSLISLISLSFLRLLTSSLEI